MSQDVIHDSHAELRALYRNLMDNQENWDEIKQLLARYPNAADEGDDEPTEAAAVRQTLNERISEWLQGPIEGLSAQQVLLLRGILVDQRWNVALAPWKESNFY